MTRRTEDRRGLSPSLAAMLTAPGWRSVVVLSGGGDPGPRLTGSVVALEVSVHPEPMDGQVLVVLLANDHTDWRIDALISRASAAGAGAVLLAGVEPLGRGAQLLAERLRLPVLGCPDPLAAHEQLRRVTAEPEVVRSDLVLRAVSALRRASGDLASVLRTTAGVLERPVTLAGADGGTLAGEPLSMTSGPDWSLRCRGCRWDGPRRTGWICRVARC